MGALRLPACAGSLVGGAAAGCLLAVACNGGQPGVLGDVAGGSDAGATAPEAGDAAIAHEAEAGPPPLDVLFIGDSYTFENDLPGTLAALASSSHVPPAITTSSVTAGANTLQDLWEAGAAPQAIASGHFTHVVLQEQSETPPCDPQIFDQFSALFASAARGRGATPALFETWARADGSADYASYPCLGGTPSAMQDALLAAYAMAATQDDAVLVPVGEAWRSVIATYPSIVLFQGDGSHPSMAGTYLSACVFYVKLTGQPVPASAGVPSGVAPGDAAQLRAVALAVAGP